MKFRLTMQSTNSKTGPIPVSTSSHDTCPPSCPLAGGKGCYAAGGPLAIVWRGLDSDGLSWLAFLRSVATIPLGALWRHNQAGDLPGKGNAIDASKLAELATVQKGRRGFTYTHKPPTAKNAAAIANANALGFTVNLSADDLSEADELAALQIAPVVVLLPKDTAARKLQTPSGRPVVVCPATYRDDVNCERCGLCAVSTRKSIVGFPAHGSSKNKASAIAQG